MGLQNGKFLDLVDVSQDKFDHDKGQISAISGRRLHWIFCFFSSTYVQFSKTSSLKSGESSEKSSGENRVKSCHVCGCHGFFGPEFRIFFIFFCSGRGKGESEAPGGGGDPFCFENPRRGGEFPGGAEGLNILFSGPKRPPS